MVEVRKCKRHGLCNNCGKPQSNDVEIIEVRASVTGQGWATIMFCKECLAALHTEIGKIIN